MIGKVFWALHPGSVLIICMWGLLLFSSVNIVNCGRSTINSSPGLMSVTQIWFHANWNLKVSPQYYLCTFKTKLMLCQCAISLLATDVNVLKKSLSHAIYSVIPLLGRSVHRFLNVNIELANQEAATKYIKACRHGQEAFRKCQHFT